MRVAIEGPGLSVGPTAPAACARAHVGRADVRLATLAALAREVDARDRGDLGGR